MTDRDEIDKLAGEFVLGTLDHDERAKVHQRRLHDPDLDQAILHWESRLMPLTDLVEDQHPPDAVYTQLVKRLPPEAKSAGTDKAVYLQRCLRRWQWMTGLSSAAALMLMAVLWFRPVTLEQQQFVAVFQQNDQQPAFLLSVDLASKELHIRPVTASSIPGKSYQLWIKADPLGPKPRSVAVLNDDLSLDPAVLHQYAPELLKQATFGISVEPQGGSPTGQPTSPAIHGYLYPAGQAL